MLPGSGDAGSDPALRARTINSGSAVDTHEQGFSGMEHTLRQAGARRRRSGGC